MQSSLSRNVSLLCPLLHSICTNKHTLHNYFPSFGPIFLFFNFSTIYFLTSGQPKVTENWLLQAHGITYLQKLQSRVCYLSIFSSLLISCIPVRALMTIILPFSSDNKRNLIICDPWWRLCSLGIMKKYFFPFYFHILYDKSMGH